MMYLDYLVKVAEDSSGPRDVRYYHEYAIAMITGDADQKIPKLVGIGDTKIKHNKNVIIFSNDAEDSYFILVYDRITDKFAKVKALAVIYDHKNKKLRTFDVVEQKRLLTKLYIWDQGNNKLHLRSQEEYLLGTDTIYKHNLKHKKYFVIHDKHQLFIFNINGLIKKISFVNKNKKAKIELKGIPGLLYSDDKTLVAAYEKDVLNLSSKKTNGKETKFLMCIYEKDSTTRMLYGIYAGTIRNNIIFFSKKSSLEEKSIFIECFDMLYEYENAKNLNQMYMYFFNTKNHNCRTIPYDFSTRFLYFVDREFYDISFYEKYPYVNITAKRDIDRDYINPNHKSDYIVGFTDSKQFMTLSRIQHIADSNDGRMAYYLPEPNKTIMDTTKHIHNFVALCFTDYNRFMAIWR